MKIDFVQLNSNPLKPYRAFSQQIKQVHVTTLLRPSLYVALMSNFRRVKCNSNNR